MAMETPSKLMLDWMVGRRTTRNAKAFLVASTRQAAVLNCATAPSRLAAPMSTDYGVRSGICWFIAVEIFNLFNFAMTTIWRRSSSQNKVLNQLNVRLFGFRCSVVSLSPFRIRSARELKGGTGRAGYMGEDHRDHATAHRAHRKPSGLIGSGDIGWRAVRLAKEHVANVAMSGEEAAASGANVSGWWS